MKNILFQVLLVITLLTAQFYPVVAASNEDIFSEEDENYIPQDTVTALSMVSQIKMQNPAANGLDVLELINVTTDPTDTDGDGLPDAVEAILGTDINTTDSDFDQLDDYNETVLYLSDPLEMDSNFDGLADNFEVTDVLSLDIDSDGVSNIWDFDNDDDGVEDNVDSSPFAVSTNYDYFNFSVSTNGNPVYIDFQLVPQTSSHVRLANQKLDWPFDNKSSMQDLDGSTEDLTIVPLLELTMDHVPDQSDVDDYGLGVSGDRVYVPLFQVNGIGGETALAGKMFYPDSSNTDINVNASLLWLVQAKTDTLDETNSTISTESTTLITYREDFTLTGLSVEESYGSDVGIFYTDDINQSIGSNFMMAYSFLRNNQSTIQDMPQELADHNITISSDIDNFAHRDLGLQSLTTEMTPDALNSLPDNRVLPIISAIQSDFTITDLSDLGSSSYVIGNDISVDMSAEPVISLKTIQTNWYNTTDNSAVDSESMLGELEDWGSAVSIDADSLQSVMALSLVWSVGESKVISVGGELQSFEFPVEMEILNEITSWVGNVVFVSFTFIDLVSNATEIAYRAFFATKYVLEAVKGFLGILLTTSESLNKTLNVVGSIAKGLNGLGEVLGVIGIITMIAGFVLDVGFALWGFFNIAMSEGWSNTGTFQGAVYASIMIAYAAVMLTIGVILLACATIPTVGWIIALVGGIIMGLIGLTDFILGIFGIGFSDLVSWIVGTFHQTYPNTECSLGMINTSLDLRDNESNGLDLGDRIIFRSYINGTITKTSSGTWTDVQNSYIIPHYKNYRVGYAETPLSYWLSDYGDYTNTISINNNYPDVQNTTYEAVAWIEPESAVLNFPVPTMFVADYNIVYTDRKIEWDFWNGYKYTIMNETDSSYTILDTLYFDVLPNSIDGLVRWNPLSALDYDHDGLANGDDPYPRSWDSDGDGLSDAFEINTTGTDPSKSDGDGDGLNDRMEIIYGTNTSDYDTDNDNMSDYLEISGWQVSFNYCNETFNMTVYSDPLSPDSDRDGLGDEEEYLNNLNPMAPTNTTDTDGDGVMDVIETAGWDVTFTNESGTYTVHVGSEPLNEDTDYDGLSDLAEYSNSTNPRDTDSDDDGLTDLVELSLGTNLLDYDSDGGRLDDNSEIIFGTDPWDSDTDGDFLSDWEEIRDGTDPLNEDTDNDGLSDGLELESCTSATDADSDDDLIPDGQEFSWENNHACNPDIDGDGVLDGYEIFYNTSMESNDTDGDGLLDGMEISNRTDPKNNDTDGDGLSDMFEIMNGTDPINGDTDGNGLNDSEDPYSFAENVERIWASYDEDEDTLELIENLEKYINVTVFNPENISNYSGRENILFVGRPGTVDDTAGNITMNILASVAPDTLSDMQESDYDRFAVEYEVWSENQTVVMLSNPYPNDHYKVLELFKTGSELEYPDAVSQFRTDSISKTGIYVMVELKEPVQPSIELTQYNEDQLPHNISFGLSSGDLGVKYLDINVSDNVMNETVNNIQRALLVIYYTGRDLDRTGDLDGNDAGDIDESSLSMIWYNETSGLWEKMSTDMDWVYELGINTENDVINGKEYEGYMWANVSHFSTYGLSGGARAESVVSGDRSDDNSPLDSDRDGLFDFIERRMGTDPFNSDTDGDGIIDSKDDTPLGTDVSDEIGDAVTSGETAVTQDDIPEVLEDEGAVPDNEDTSGSSASFWLVAVVVIALLAGIVILKRKG
ncbi:hypothetical protein [Methanolobus bombayensis]|uniref:hypothetical protein n=1 Tax=Methanolobus bombayensis TaxID=38023 RepID=UPI001AE49FD8|nr:hypothetical protein [Methanolobus bombayensis]MBP1909749.1 hypothetical protein [Methanolobus bombayensis]